jgi:N utilization substance protein A
MNSELQTILTYMERERGIDREVLIQAVEYALQSASRKAFGSEQDLRIEIDRETCDIKAFAERTVVEDTRPGAEEISLAGARKIRPDAEVGSTVEIEVTPKNLGRIAAQTAKQAILQKIRQAERDIVFEEYKDRAGDIVSGSVRQFNRSDIIVDLGRAEAVIPARERVPTEEYQVGDRIRAFVLEVQQSAAGPAIILSRGHPDFVRKLFELEVSEINDGVVVIKGIAREPGYRTKIAVLSNDEKVDPVGACVGMRGMRVKNIVRELSGEKIDIIRWSDDTKTYVTNALSPAKLSKVTVDPNNPGLIHVVADPEQLSLAIGKRGQNVRLTAKLLNLKIDIQKDESEMSFEEKVAKAVESMASVEGIGREHAGALVKAGFLTVEGILAAEEKDLVEMAGLDAEAAKAIYEAAAKTQQADGDEQQTS